MNLFQSFPDDARVWIYASDRILTEAEQQTLREAAQKFMASWTSHERPMDAAFEIVHDTFLILVLNEQQFTASGCGIDKSVAFFKEAEKMLGINLFNRLQIEILSNEKLIITNKKQIAEMITTGAIESKTITFNKQITSLGEWKKQFQIPLNEAWFWNSVSNKNTILA